MRWWSEDWHCGCFSNAVFKILAVSIHSRVTHTYTVQMLIIQPHLKAYSVLGTSHTSHPLIKQYAVLHITPLPVISTEEYCTVYIIFLSIRSFDALVPLGLPNTGGWPWQKSLSFSLLQYPPYIMKPSPSTYISLFPMLMHPVHSCHWWL